MTLRRAVRACAATKLLALPPLAAAAFVIAALAGGDGASSAAQTAGDDLGARLYSMQCASCHGTDGTGVEGRGPSLEPEGRASVDFAVRTGRMPLAAPDIQATRQPVRFTEEQIVALVDYAGGFGDGPDIPTVVTDGADLTAGGELYRLNCASCHVASGAGAAIGGGVEAPSLAPSTPTVIGEAILIGPGAMPSFGSFTSDDINDVAAYIEHLEDSDATGWTSFGGSGPVAEGLAAWLLALVPLIALTRWIGTPHEHRDPSEQPGVAPEPQIDQEIEP